ADITVTRPATSASTTPTARRAVERRRSAPTTRARRTGAAATSCSVDDPHEARLCPEIRKDVTCTSIRRTIDLGRMNYLYGDSTPSPLKSNFLEFLRDDIDFGVFALLADDRIRLGREQVESLRQKADE